MKGLDTNILVRYVTRDDPRQAAVAARAINRASEAGETLLIHPVVLCELVWVLESGYRYRRTEVAAALTLILQTAQFEILDRDVVCRALREYKHGRGDFSDYLLGQANRANGADKTLTFDQALEDSPIFEVLSP